MSSTVGVKFDDATAAEITELAEALGLFKGNGDPNPSAVMRRAWEMFRAANADQLEVFRDQKTEIRRRRRAARR